MIESAPGSDRKFKAFGNNHKLRRYESKAILEKKSTDNGVPGVVPDPEMLSCDPYARSRQLLVCGHSKEKQGW
jgi:hypothetical protein